MTSPSWTAGYISDVAYTLGFYREMAPPFLDYVCALNGYTGPRRTPMRYCELGCGRGYGTALLAPANPDSSFVGIDFNPAHIREARSLAEQAGLANVTFLESSFAEAARSGNSRLDAFDIVALHGVYSWVSQQVRDDLHELLRVKLVAGGVAFISYNTYPGWAPSSPVQHLLKQFADRASGDSLDRLRIGRTALATLGKSTNGFVPQNPGAQRRIEMMDAQNPAYVAHEFLNENWHPLYVDEAMAMLAEAKLSYVGSATIGENRPELCVPQDLAALVQSAPDTPLRELLKDFASNKQFRRDVYIKGANRTPGRDALKRLDEIVVALVDPGRAQATVWPVPAGSATLGAAEIEAIVSALAGGPATIGDVRARAVEQGVPETSIGVIVEILIHNNVICPCRPDFATVERSAAQRLNNVVFEFATGGDSHRFLASPVLGSGIAAPYFDLLAAPLIAGTAASSDAEVAGAVDKVLETAGKRFMRDGKPLERSTETTAQVESMVRTVREAGLPQWRALGAIS